MGVVVELMARERLYATNAERQAAYRARLTERLTLAGTGQAADRLAELERALADANRRADQAEARARRAEQAAVGGDRAGELAAALRRIAVLEATVADLRAQLSATAPAAPPPTPGLNRAARRAAQRDRRRRH